MVLLLLSVCYCQKDSFVYYISPDVDASCTEACLTLSDVSANPDNYLVNNSTLVFLHGKHILSESLILSHKYNVSMRSFDTTQILCRNSSHISFQSSEYILIEDIDFIGCGGNEFVKVNNLSFENVSFTGQDGSGTALILVNSQVKISRSSFISNKNGVPWNTVASVTLDKYYSRFDPMGYIYEYFMTNGCHDDDYETLCTARSGSAIYANASTVLILKSLFKDNVAEVGGAIFANDAEISIYDTTFLDNHGGELFLTCAYDIPDYGDDIDFDCSNDSFGGVLYESSSNVSIDKSSFISNTALFGGVIFSSDGKNMIITNSKFTLNTAKEGGALALYVYQNRDLMDINKCHFKMNHAIFGGVLYKTGHNSKISAIIRHSSFVNNSAKYSGGVILSSEFFPLEQEMYIIIYIIDCIFKYNSASSGGVLYLYEYSAIQIKESRCESNYASAKGGVIFSSERNIHELIKSKFDKNSAQKGAVIYSKDSFTYINASTITENVASDYAILYFVKSRSKLVESTISNNVGSLFSIFSNITIINKTAFTMNTPSQHNVYALQEGGSVTLFQSNLYFFGTSTLENNHADKGGAIYSTESKLHVFDTLVIAHNEVTRNGGGIYLVNSELIFRSENNLIHPRRLTLFNNTAREKGGGIHAIASFIRLDLVTFFTLNVTGNKAKYGGGLSLEGNTKLYISFSHRVILLSILFTSNKAHYGGALYVNDDTNYGACTSYQCFFQVIDYNDAETDLKGSDHEKKFPSYNKIITFSQNYASKSGSDTYGGLLDRCTVSQLSNSYNDSGLSYFMKLSNKNINVSSDPVKVCFCNKSGHNYHLQHEENVIEVMKGQTFAVSVVAIDQAGHPIEALIQSSLKYTDSGLGEGQLTKSVTKVCTNLSYSVTSPQQNEELSLYALNGPCKDADASKVTLKLNFLPCKCPIGFQVSNGNHTNCTCNCAATISPYVLCDAYNQSFMKLYKSNAWINYENMTSGYLVYPNCPYDYCKPLNTTWINLNHPNGADEQCALNHSSILCGSCQKGFSLSLGSSKCLSCPRYWPVLFILITTGAIIAGILLVAFLMILNLTVAVGTMNGIIFFINILHVNRNILLPIKKTNVFTMLVSWLNLELGIDSCFFKGMDAYSKVWVQFAFPNYVIFIVVSIIIACSYSSRLSKLIGRKNPVATLATLILFSYTKMIEIIFKSLSYGILMYPDGTNERIWLLDASIKYLKGKHIALFIAAVIFLIVGVLFTVLIFSWQWLLLLPPWKIFSWARNTKLLTFIETYHTPYTPRHRYWTGLLLIIRAILYLVSAIDGANDPQIVLTSITFTMCCLLFFKGIFGRLYRNCCVDLLDTFFYFNTSMILVLAWYTQSHTDSEWSKVVQIMVIIITFMILFFIVCYHIYTFTALGKMLQSSIVPRVTTFGDNVMFRRFRKPRSTSQSTQHAPIAAVQHMEPTYSVVELSNPLLQPYQAQ